VIIALGHRKQQGKDTVADILVRDHNWQKIGFADALYDMCYELFKRDGFKQKAFYDQNPAAKEEKLANGHTPRFLLLHFGKVLREIDPEYWVRRVETRILTSGRGANWVITDLRNFNEVDMIKWRVGGHLVRVDRPGYATTTYPGDIDEILKDYDRWDYVLQNDREMADLGDRVVEMLKALGG